MFVAVIAYWSVWHVMVSMDIKGDGGDEPCLGHIFKTRYNEIT